MRIAQWTGLWALLCFCGIVAPGVADADWKIDRAKAVAAKAWSDPCPGRVQILYAPPKQPGWLASTIKGYCQVTLSDREVWPWKHAVPGARARVRASGRLPGPAEPRRPVPLARPGRHHVRLHPPGWPLRRLRDALSRHSAAGRLQPDPELRISTGIARRGRARRATSAKSRARARAHRRAVRR